MASGSIPIYHQSQTHLKENKDSRSIEHYSCSPVRAAMPAAALLEEVTKPTWKLWPRFVLLGSFSQRDNTTCRRRRFENGAVYGYVLVLTSRMAVWQWQGAIFREDISFALWNFNYTWLKICRKICEYTWKNIEEKYSICFFKAITNNPFSTVI